MARQIQSYNSASKFPLAPNSSEDIPTDILLDMSLTLPAGAVPVLSVLTTTTATVFIALADGVTGAGLAHVAITTPTSFTMYELTADAANVSGFVVFGPGCHSAYNSGRRAEPIDMGALTHVSNINTLTGVDIDGDVHAMDITAPLELSSRDGSVLFERVGDTIKMSVSELAYTVQHGTGPRNPNGLILSLGGATPDKKDGNINIVGGIGVESITYVPGGGLRIASATKPCLEVSPLTNIQHGRCDAGTGSIQLPLDAVIEALVPDYTKEDCGCAQQI